MMRCTRAFAICGLAALQSACAVRQYDVEMTRAGDQFERRTVLTEHRITPTSDAAPPPPAPKVISEATTRFASETPDDVGGAGSVTLFQTTLGTFGVYLERFRGDDDPAARVWNIRIASGELAELITGWLESELGQTPGFERLREWCQRQLRPDLENLMLYSWISENGSPPGSGREFDAFARLVQYLVERGYLTVADVPRIMRVDPSGGEATGLLRLAREFIAVRMGLDPSRPLPDSFAFLATSDAVRASAEAYIRTTELYRKAASRPGSANPAPLSVLGDRAVQLAPNIVGRFFGGEVLTLKLILPVEPLVSNGQWDADEGRITWDASLPARDGDEARRPLPVVAYAAWAEPDRAAQASRFGRTVLDGELLARYCVWRKGLTAAEGAAWDAVISAITPDRATAPAIRSLLPIGALGDEVAEQGVELLCTGIEDPAGARPHAPITR